MRACKYGARISGAAMNRAYEIIAGMTCDQIRQAKDLSHVTFPPAEGDIFRRQCDVILARRARERS